MISKFVLPAAAVIWLAACCGSQHDEPIYPRNVDGWRDFKDGTTKLRGSFVLSKGASTDNGLIKIKVLDLLAPECTGDAGDFSARARVILGFYRVTDEFLLCSETFPENGGGNLPLPAEFGIFGVGIRGINLRDNWVYFFIDGTY